MNIEIQSLGITISPALADRARRGLHFVLMQRRELVQRVVVRFGGSNNMYCLMHVQMCDAFAATVVDIGPEIHAAIDRTTDRVGRLVVERLEQTRCRRLRAGASAATAPPQAMHVAPRAGKSVTAHVRGFV